MKPTLQVLGRALGIEHLWLVGGAVRDELLGRPHADWDLATDLMPEAVMTAAKAAGLKVFPTGLQHGTITVMVEAEPFEITTFRSDGDYRDGRRPDSVKLGVTLEEDLSRRDFTINAMAIPLAGGGIVDPYGGRKNLEVGLIRAVGDPLKRFQEDGLRPLRACRFAAQLGFAVDAATLAAIPQRLEVAKRVAVERVFQEMQKLLTGLHARRGMELLAESGLMDLWMPELRPMIGCGQNRHHRFPVWEHSLGVLALAPREPAQRWAALLHDAGKPPTRSVEKGEVHFYGHEAISLRIAEDILRRLKAPHDLIARVLALVKHHGTYPGPEWGDAACRRFLRHLAEDHLLLAEWGAFRLADMLGKGFGEEPYRTDHAAIMARLEALQAAKPPLSVKDLALNGRALMALADRTGGPWLGALQKHLLEVVIEDPAKNTLGILSRIAAAELKMSRLA
ncbi:MAG: HD domain-containing protein [Acidobacteria bacterium]|nr:HD domain-containing protein [Acidobacteriota bacterium]